MNRRGRARMTRRTFGRRRRGAVAGFSIATFDPESSCRSSRVEQRARAVLYARAMSGFARSRVLRFLAWAVAIVIAILLVPYVIAPFYRFGHPISALMLERRLAG